MFCCGTESKDQNELVIYNLADNSLKSILNRDQKNINELIENVGNYITIRPSRYDEYVKDCKAKGHRFADPEFPPNDSSLNVNVGRRVTWKRVTDIVKNAVMVEGHIEPSDIQQGNVGDCYFLSSLSAIAEVPGNIEQIFENNLHINELGIYKLIINNKG